MKTAAIFIAFIIGYFVPQAAALNWMIRYMIVIMMFVTMLRIRFSFHSFRWSHLGILAANLAIGLGSWGLLQLAGETTLAQAAFFTGITPTAAAAPVIVGILGGRIDYCVNSFLVTNIGVALLLPVLIPLVMHQSAGIMVLKVIGDLLFVIALPLAAALLVRKCWKNYTKIMPFATNGVFYIWVTTIFLIISNASNFIRRHGAEHSKSILLEIAGASLALCVINFTVGHFLEKPSRRRESSQTLGQKNTTLTIFLAITYASPLVALGPTFYVIWHNTWNAIQIRMRERHTHIKALRHGGVHAKP